MNASILIAAVALIFSVVTYIHNRRVELAWKRTEFLLAQSWLFDNDQDLIEMVKMLNERHSEVTVPALFNGSVSDIGKKNEYLRKMDKLLDFLWRICFAYLETKTISKKEVEGWGWYFWRIAHYPVLMEYCDDDGYEEINITIKKLGYIEELKEEMEQEANKPSPRRRRRNSTAPQRQR